MEEVTIRIPIVNGVGTVLTNDLPTHLGKLKLSCPVDLGRRSMIGITFTGNTYLLSCSVPLNPEGRTNIEDFDIGVTTAITATVAEPDGVENIDAEFIPYTEWL